MCAEGEEQEKPVRHVTALACSRDIACPRGSSLCGMLDPYRATGQGEPELRSLCLQPEAISWITLMDPALVLVQPIPCLLRQT